VTTSDALSSYAQLLSDAGFRIYMPKSAPSTHFIYSQPVMGRECFGLVQRDEFGAFQHLMPIRPSKQHGALMSVQGVGGELTVEAARRVALPDNRNDLAGTHHNFYDREWLERLHTQWN
jgi:hypothetical protein